jgi:hypothetical protein
MDTEAFRDLASDCRNRRARVALGIAFAPGWVLGAPACLTRSR